VKHFPIESQIENVLTKGVKVDSFLFCEEKDNKIKLIVFFIS